MDIPIETAAELFKILSDPTRLRIIEILTLECTSVSAIGEKTGFSQPLVSHHLRILRQAGLARADPRNGYTYYCLRDPAVWETVEECCQLLLNIQKDSGMGEPLSGVGTKTGRRKAERIPQEPVIG